MGNVSLVVVLTWLVSFHLMISNLRRRLGTITNINNLFRFIEIPTTVIS